MIYLSNPPEFTSSFVLVYLTHKEKLYTQDSPSLCHAEGLLEIRVRYRTLLGYTILVLGTNKFKNNTNQINSRILIKAFFHLMHKNEYHH